MSLEKIVLIPDLHCGDEDQRAIDLACQVTESLKPDKLIFLGDILDSGWASSYPQNLSDIKGIVKREKVAWYATAKKFVDAAPQAVRVAVPGNHDWRVIRGFAWAHPEFDGDETVDLRAILKVNEFGIAWKDSPAAVMLAGGNFVATHGIRVRSRSGASGMAEMSEEWWCSGISGHTHRMGQVFRTVHRGVYCWTEGGHLSNRIPKYKPINKVSPMDWQQGISVMYVGVREFSKPDLIPFWYKGRKIHARYGDREFTA